MDLTAARWRKARRSTNNGGNCVELARIDRVVAVRDSKDPAGPALTFTPAQWAVFAAGAKRNRYDL